MTDTRLQIVVSRGFTLVELMVTVGILAVIAAIAAPIFSGYISSSHEGVMKDNIQTVRLFEKNYQLQHKVYISGTYDPTNPGAANGLKSRIGWAPRTQKDSITYVVICEVPDSDPTKPQCDRSGGYYVTATDTDGTTECTGFEGASCP